MDRNGETVIGDRKVPEVFVEHIRPGRIDEFAHPVSGLFKADAAGERQVVEIAVLPVEDLLMARSVHVDELDRIGISRGSVQFRPELVLDLGALRVHLYPAVIQAFRGWLRAIREDRRRQCAEHQANA